MKTGQRVLITIGVGIVLIVAFYIITTAITKYTGFSVSPIDSEDVKEKNLKNCLAEKNIVLYINTENPSEVLRSIEPSKYLSSIKIINCQKNSPSCRGINDFPAWDIEQKRIQGDISTKRLAEVSGCEL